MNSRLLAEVSLAFADQEAFGIQLGSALKALCTELRLSRAYMYLDGQNLPTMGYTHEWCAEGVVQQWMQDIPYVSYAAWLKALTENGRIVSSDTTMLPDDLRTALEYGGIRSLQAYPVDFEGQIVGFLAYDQAQSQRNWTDEETELLEGASAIIAAFCEREILREQIRMIHDAPARQAEPESIRDPLTGTFNRRYVFDRLTGFDAEYARLGRNFCISLLEIDQFDALSENYGRETADFVLKEFASVLSSSIRPYDLSGRFGDKEFIIVSVNASALETGYLIERLRNAIHNHAFTYGAAQIRPVFNYGIADSAEFSPENLSIDKMVELAGERLRSDDSESMEETVSSDA